ncbi:hypothetical protein [uncultured Chryseobacterium sp.]|uniref:hypothetical protein n=1 Tax=uncultured Chryseobacterium sp. TaxID=259322 RepID=UPI0025E6BC4C|nr:hypothetical protein [uncultured Chryseobacterium sp.]
MSRKIIPIRALKTFSLKPTCLKTTETFLTASIRFWYTGMFFPAEVMRVPPGWNIASLKTGGITSGGGPSILSIITIAIPMRFWVFLRAQPRYALAVRQEKR